RMADAPRPLRLAYAGPVFRARAGQLDPARELTQAGAELIRAALGALQAAGVTDISLDLTTPELVASLASGPWPVGDLEGVLRALDGKDWGALGATDTMPYRALLEATGLAETALPRLAPHAPELVALLEELVAALPGVRVTIDPTERHGFEYHSWVGFTLYGAAQGKPFAHEIGRGGAYLVQHPGGKAEPAAGVSLYVDPLVDAGLGQSARERVFLDRSASPEIAAKLRAEGWATVQALSDTDSGDGCSHRWNGREPVAKG
ncbi:MAG: ATP phosphoribosyltransferase regulatory subunit, partial [Sandaracinobacteroides sp.]